jgi:DNA-binding beta-propeller fold protein YncE
MRAVMLASLCCAFLSAQATEAAPPPVAVAPPPRAAIAVYSTRGDDRIHFVTADTLEPLGSHEVGAGAHELAISDDGRWVMGSAYGGPGPGHQPADKRLFVFDVAAGKLARTIDLGDLKRPNDIAFLPGSSEAVVTVEMPPRVLRVHADTGAFTAIDIERKTGHMLALGKEPNRVYVSHVAPGSLSVIDLEAGKVLANHALPLGAEGFARTPDGAQLWVGCNRSNAMVVFDLATAKVAHQLECPGFPLRVRASPDGKLVAASCPMSREVALFATAKPAEVARVDVRSEAVADAQPADPMPTSLSFTPDGSAILVVCAAESGGELARIDVATRKVTHRVAAQGPIADALAVGLLPAKR